MASIEQLLNKGLKPLPPPIQEQESKANNKIIPVPQGVTSEASSKVILSPEGEKSPKPKTVGLPRMLGHEFDSVLKYGSWVRSGVEKYKAEIDKQKTIFKFAERFTNIHGDDFPQAVLFTISNALKSNPIPAPADMSHADNNMFRQIVNSLDSYPIAKPLSDKLKDRVPDTKVGRLFSGDNPVKWLGKDGEDPKAVIKPSAGSFAYQTLSDPYDGEKKLGTTTEIKKYLNELNFGYKKWAGFEIGTDHLWNISMHPYKPDKYGSVFEEFPSYTLPNIFNNTIGRKEFNFGTYLPVIHYDLQFGNQIQKEIPLYNGSQFRFPTGFAYDMSLSMDIIDDVYHSMKKYLVQCLNKIYNIDKTEVASFFRAAWEIDLTVYRAGFEKNYRVQLVGCPIGYTHTYEGQTEPDETKIHLQLAIVGIKDPGSKNTTIGTNEWERSMNWTEVTLSPNGGVTDNVKERKKKKVVTSADKKITPMIT